MRDKESNSKLLASYALFKELTKNGKHIHDVLLNFLIDTIQSKQLFSFSVSTVNGYLKEIYEFQIPDAVIKTLLKKLEFLKYEFQTFTVIDKKLLSESHFDIQETQIEKNNNEIIEKLYSYIEGNRNIELNVVEKKKILQSFTDFILDNNSTNCYMDDISLFIVLNQNDIKFIDNLQTIKDGVILYTGIKYNQNFDLYATWKSKMTIYLNTEILFHLSNYNGEIFRTLFFDFYNLVKEINSKQKLIFLKYFQETKNEIEYFFSKAEKIVQGFDTLNPSNTAMSTIVNGCTDATDVIVKKVKLFSLLDQLGISEETEDIVYSKENYKYNIANPDIEKNENDIDKTETIESYLKILNMISIKRNDKEKYNLEDIGYIFLTENRKIRNIAWNEEIKEQGVVPLATTLQFLTNKFWFKLNKGFGGSDVPSSFSVITKAQILISHHLSEKLNDEYYKLKKDIGRNELSENEVILVLHELRERAKLPEDIVANNFPSILNTITTESYEEFIIEKNNTHKILKEQSNKNDELAISLKNSHVEKEKLTVKTKQLKQNILLEKEKILGYLKKTKDRIDTKIDKKYQQIKLKIFLPLPIIYIILAFLTYFYGWNKLEPIIWILTIALPFIGSCIYLYKKEKNFNIYDILKRKKEMIIKKEYESENFEIDEIRKKENEINDLQKDLIS